MRHVRVPRACASASHAHSLCASRIARCTIRAASAAELHDGLAIDGTEELSSHHAKGGVLMPIFARNLQSSRQKKSSARPLRGGGLSTVGWKYGAHIMVERGAV